MTDRVSAAQLQKQTTAHAVSTQRLPQLTAQLRGEACRAVTHRHTDSQKPDTSGCTVKLLLSVLVDQ